MSVNHVQLGPEGLPLLLPGESFMTQGNTATISLFIPPSLQGPKRTESATGRITLTDKRVIFVADSPYAPSTSSGGGQAEPDKHGSPPKLNSLEVAYNLILSATYNLPTFSASHILLTFLASPYSKSLPQVGAGQYIEAKIVVGEGAGHGIWKRIEGERSTSGNRLQVDEDGPPAYEGASAPSSGAPPAFDSPPPDY